MIDSDKISVILCTRSGAAEMQHKTIWGGLFRSLRSVSAQERESRTKTTVGDEEASMVAELNLLEVWIPEQMQPGTLFLLEQAGELGKADNPYWAVLACPTCGSLGLITRQQCAGLEAMICGSSECSAEYFLEDQTIRYRLAS
jgi:hypothetical protein